MTREIKLIRAIVAATLVAVVVTYSRVPAATRLLGDLNALPAVGAALAFALASFVVLAAGLTLVALEWIAAALGMRHSTACCSP